MNIRVSWNTTQHGSLRTITPEPHRTLWMISLIRTAEQKQHSGVQSGTLTRTDAIANHAARYGGLKPDDIVIATHSIVRNA